MASTKVHVRPDIYMIDTPGIFLPEISDPEVGMKFECYQNIRNYALLV